MAEDELSSVSESDEGETHAAMSAMNDAARRPGTCGTACAMSEDITKLWVLPFLGQPRTKRAEGCQRLETQVKAGQDKGTITLLHL